MKFFTRFVATALAVVGAFAQNMTINSLTSVIVCRPSLITWSGGQFPYYLTILPAGQISGVQALVEFPPQSGTSLTWIANLPYGSSGFLNLRDSNGLIAQSANFIVGNSTDTSCLTKPLSVSSGPSPTSSGGSSSVPSSTKTASSKSNSTGDALPHSQFHIGAVAIVGAVTFALVG